MIAININSLYKGLLGVVILCFLYVSCSSSATPTSNSFSTIDTIPNPIQYLLFGSNEKTSSKSDTLSAEELALLQNGDILLRKGFGSISAYIAAFLQEKYPVTHCGFVTLDNNNNNKISILHTMSNDSLNGMHLEALPSYLRQSQENTLIAVRLKSSPSQIKEVLNKAQALLQQKIPFDLAFDDKDSSSLYCLEMMRNVFLDVYQQDLLPQRTQKQLINVLRMDNFFDTTYFEVLFNHFERNKE